MEKSFEAHETLLYNHAAAFAPLETLYIGGGTPGFWGEEGAYYLAQFLKDRGIKLASNCEFTLEVNPGSTQQQSLLKWFNIGVNRVSVGVQSFSAEYLKALDRIHSLADAVQILKFLKQQKINFSVDLMIGLPQIGIDRNLALELQTALDLGAKHLSVYILTTGKSYIHGKHLPKDDVLEREFLEVSKFLSSHGLVHYEVSNFGLPGFFSQHNLAYWRSQSVAALGPSATGLIVSDNKNAVRYKWHPERLQPVIENLGEKELRLENLYLKMRTFEGLSVDELLAPVKVKFKNQVQEDLSHLIGTWNQARYLEPSGINNIKLAPSGFIMLDSLMGDLFKIRNLI